jgi:hypothetical protein
MNGAFDEGDDSTSHAPAAAQNFASDSFSARLTGPWYDQRCKPNVELFGMMSIGVNQ